jgi:hypothetical protein
MAEAEISAAGPPGQRPAIEQLAERLREAGRARDAAGRYEEVLRRFPNRSPHRPASLRRPTPRSLRARRRPCARTTGGQTGGC